MNFDDIILISHFKIYLKIIESYLLNVISGAFTVKECAWNAYPYTKTKFTVSTLPNRFSISIETKFLSDPGNSENVFNLTDEQMNEIDYKKCIDHIDMCGCVILCL